MNDINTIKKPYYIRLLCDIKLILHLQNRPTCMGYLFYIIPYFSIFFSVIISGISNPKHIVSRLNCGIKKEGEITSP